MVGVLGRTGTGVGVLVGGIGVGVLVGSIGVGVLVGVAVGVPVGAGVGVLVGIGVGVLVGVGGGVLVGVGGGVLVGIAVGVLVGVAVGVLVGIGVGVLVGVAVGVETGVEVGEGAMASTVDRTLAAMVASASGVEVGDGEGTAIATAACTGASMSGVGSGGRKQAATQKSMAAIRTRSVIAGPSFIWRMVYLRDDLIQHASGNSDCRAEKFGVSGLIIRLSRDETLRHSCARRGTAHRPLPPRLLRTPLGCCVMLRHKRLTAIMVSTRDGDRRSCVRLLTAAGMRRGAMPRGPNGERRPADTNACAVMVAKIATGQIEEGLPSGRRRGGLKGGPARAAALSPQRRSEIARQANAARRRRENK